MTLLRIGKFGRRFCASIDLQFWGVLNSMVKTFRWKFAISQQTAANFWQRRLDAE